MITIVAFHSAFARFAGRAGLQPPAPLGGERKEHDEKAMLSVR